MKLEELHLGDGFIKVPSAFIHRALDSISSRTLNHLTIELSGRSQVREATWDALDEGLVRLRGRQEIGDRLAVEISTPLPAEEVHGRLPCSGDRGPLLVGYRCRPSRW